MKELVFVFGTLKEGFPNFETNRGERMPGNFTTIERYPFYLVGTRCSPWLIDMPGQGERVAGQVFAVDQDALDAMDRLERVTESDGYRRVSVEVEAENGSALTAHAYLKQARHLNPRDVHLGPLSEYTLEHAALYRPRS